MADFNAQVIADFRANDGKVGGNFEGAPMVLLHHTGVKSGTEYIAPLVYKAGDDADSGVIYVFASAAGAPKHPQWYTNIVAAGRTTVEVGAETYPVEVDDLQGAERDRVFAEQVAAMPGFGEYEKKTEGIRTIPVVALRRVSA